MKKFIALLFFTFLFSSSYSQVTTLGEGFESWPPVDWETYFLGTATDGWRQDFEAISHSGVHSAYSSIDNSQCDNWLVSPQIDITNSSYQLKFWDYNKSITWYDKASVLISTGSGDPTDGDYLEVYTTPIPLNLEVWEERTIDLSAYDGQSIYVAFRYEGTWHQWYVDDVAISPDTFLDGALTAIVNPVGVSETAGVEDIIITLTNQGSITIQDVDIDWEINGISQPQFNATSLNLASGNSTNLTIGNFNFSTDGVYSIGATLALAGDFDSSNNTITGTYTVSAFKDGALTGISPEGISPITGSQDVIAYLENPGVNTIDIAQIVWSVNGVNQTPFSTTSLNLQPGSSIPVVLGQFNFTSGVYQIEGTLDAIGDINSDNDTYLATAAIDTFYESFEGNQFPPEHWSIVFGTHENSNFGNPYEGDKYYGSQPDSNFFGTVLDTIYSPRLQIENGDTYSFYIKTSSFQPTDNDLIWKNGTTGEVTVIQSINPTPNSWQHITVDISAAQGNNYIGITSTVTSAPGFAAFDLFTSTANIHLYDQDLEIKNGDLYFLAGDNVNEGFDCLIKNVGALSVLGANYTVKLMEAPGVVLATANGVNLSSWEEATITVNHTFSGESSHRLYFEIEFAQDEELENNTFREADVHVVSPTSILDAMGQKNDVDLNFPFNANGNMNSLGEDDISQTLYLNSDFENPGEIYGMVYSYYNLLQSDRVQELPMKVWISQTQTTDLSSGYLPNSELVLVFDGVVEILPGFNRELYIPFDQPIPYSGIDNIVVQDYQYDPEWWPSIPRFYKTNNAGPDVRTISNLDYFALDPLVPPTFFNAFTDYSYTRFVINPQVNTSVLSGNVTDTFNNDIADATVAIEGTSITSQTDANGDYQLIALPYGTYDITASKFGYVDQTISTTLDAPTTIQDFVLQERAIVEINGRVVGSNDIAVPLENVQIAMEGYVNGNTNTDNLGEFSFTNVYGDADYELTFNLYGYYEKTVVVNVVDETIELGDVILNQEFISPFDVTVTADTETTIVWKSPLLSDKVKLQNDYDVNSYSYTNEPNENVWLGNIFTISDITTITSVEIRTDIYPNAVDFVTIDVLDATTEEILASSEPFLIEQDALMDIDIPNIVVYDDILVAIHWQNNAESTNSLVIDYSDPAIPNTAIIKYPSQTYELLSEFFGGGAPNMSFHVRVNSLDDGTPDTNNEVLTYNVRRGLASEFPDISNWEILNPAPITDLTYVDVDWPSTNPSEQYRFAVETIYSEDISEVTFSNSIDGYILGVEDIIMDSSIIVYPVPTKDILTIRFNSYLSELDLIQIVDVLGRYVNKLKGNPTTDNEIHVNVSNLNNGVYFAKINCNGTVITKRFVISR